MWENCDNIEEVSNLNKKMIFDWKKQKKEVLKTKFKKCNKCSYFNECEWVWNEYFDSYWNSEFIPIN